MRRTSVALFVWLLAATGAGAQTLVADAVMNRDAAALRALLQKKADVNAAQVDGSTALHWAVYHDNLQAADLLLSAGANVKAVTREGVTPLSMATLYGSVPMVERLLKAGADAKERGPNGETMLMFAARNGNPRLVELFLNAGVDVNAAENLRKTTALMWAVEQQHPEAVRALLKAGANPAAKSGPAGLPRNYMANRVNQQSVREAQERRKRAAAAGRTYEEQVLFERAAPLRPAFDQQPPPDDDSEVVVAGLVGSGGGGLAALHLAAREGDIESARALLDGGADVNQVTEYAWTPLYIATDNRNIEGGDYPVPKPDLDHLEIITKLLDKGANPDARVKEDTLTRTIFTMQWFFEDGATAFARAAQSSDTVLMKLLLKYGADPRLATRNGDTAITLAGGIGWVEGVTYERSREENVEALRMLLDLGLDPNTANSEGRTALMGAALKGRNEAIQLLVDRGARLDLHDHGSRDTDKIGSAAAGHTWQAIDYADGLVRAGVQGAIAYPETSAFIRKLMIERGLEVPPANRNILSVCVVSLCQGW